MLLFFCTKNRRITKKKKLFSILFRKIFVQSQLEEEEGENDGENYEIFDPLCCCFSSSGFWVFSTFFHILHSFIHCYFSYFALFSCFSSSFTFHVYLLYHVTYARLFSTHVEYQINQSGKDTMNKDVTRWFVLWLLLCA